MYEFVNGAEIKPYRSYCSEILTELRKLLSEEHEIKSQIILVGSGARNMVMRNGADPFDLDYNLIISSMPDEFRNNLRKLKSTVISSLNKIVGKTCFSDGHDSTSVVSSYLYLNNTPVVKFKLDIAILSTNSQGDFCRLIHDKRLDVFNWCEVPSSKNVRAKADKLKKLGKWGNVRSRYRKLKNLYLSQGDRDHPSFVVYVEAVNLTYKRFERSLVMGKNHNVSGNTHSKSQLNNYANQNNPNNSAYRANMNNHAKQCNPNNSAYGKSGGKK